MNVSLNWLNEYLQPPVQDVQEAVDALTRVGFGCEAQETIPSTGDTRLDFEITSNRGDCVCVVGLARELAAATGRKLVISEPERSVLPADLPDDRIPVTNDATDLCPLYTARVIRGVKVGPSPQWLRDRLEAVGQRTVNNIVDVTNFVLFELGQPLHAFDLAKVGGPAIVVRRANAVEKLTAIDGTKLTLDPSMLIIADTTRPIAVAGVMGGIDSEVCATTTDILLEAAVFAPASVRSTSRRLRLSSPSSYRFERGINPATVEAAADRAVELIVKVAGGTPGADPAVAGAASRESEPKQITMRISRCQALAGIRIRREEMLQILTSLGFNPRVDDTNSAQDGEQRIVCIVPKHRLDIEREVDLIEEVVRLYGLDKIESKGRITIDVAHTQEPIERRRRLSRALCACGYYEVVLFSLLSQSDAATFLTADQRLLTLQDDRRSHEPALQSSILPGLLRCRKHNQDQGHKSVSLFQTGACFALQSDGSKSERNRLGLICDAPDKQVGLRRIRAAVEQLATEVLGCGINVSIEPEEVHALEPSSGARIELSGTKIGQMGLMSKAVQDHFGLEAPVAGAELDLDALLALPASPVGQLVIHTTPAIERDLSVVVAEAVRWRAIESVVQATQPPFLENIAFVGIYRGKPVEKGLKSVTFRMTFRDSLKTLRHEEVDPSVSAVVSRLSADLDAKLRE